uniref:Major facilitator superfamily (MFS) profile domain-containing protein n=1 Tax=Pundamilia nyererei TaxID=303518 RepID=A0A3B4FVB5_9CICH
MLSRAGSSISPYLLQLAVFYEFLPWMLVGSLSLVSVVLCFFLPETFREPLPDTIDQMQFCEKPSKTLNCYKGVKSVSSSQVQLTKHT